MQIEAEPVNDGVDYTQQQGIVAKGKECPYQRQVSQQAKETVEVILSLVSVE